MKNLAVELKVKVEELSRDQNDLEKLINSVSIAIETSRKDHSAIAGAVEAAIGIAAISIGASLFCPVDYDTKVPELIGAAFGAGTGGGVGGIVTGGALVAYKTFIGGIGIAMGGPAFAIPVAAITAMGAAVGALSGSLTGWFGVELASHTMSLAEMLFANISGTALVAFGCYMLFLSMKDLWRAGGEFIAYLKSTGISEITTEELS